jgi:hypothetical protein
MQTGAQRVNRRQVLDGLGAARVIPAVHPSHHRGPLGS